MAIRHEGGAKRLLRRMVRDDVLVEQCLTSNAQILEIEGRYHSFPVYRRFGVPIALCTDDEGIARTDLTEQFLIAARSYDLSYRAPKQISRDSLEHSFLQPAAKRAALRGLDAGFEAFERRFR